MNFYFRALLSFLCIFVLSFFAGCISVEIEDEYVVEVITDDEVSDIAISDDLREEFPKDALDVEISTLVGTWARNGMLLGGIRPPRIETSDYKLIIYSRGDNYYVDYSFTIKERINLDGNKRSRRNVLKISDLNYKKIPFKKEKFFFVFTIPDTNKKLYFIAKKHKERIVLEKTDPVLIPMSAPFKTYYVKEDSK